MQLNDFASIWLPNAISVAVFIYAIAGDRRAARKSELDEVKASIAALSAKHEADLNDGHSSREKVAERLTRVEGQLAQMPDKETVHRVEVAVARMEGDVKAQGSTMNALADNVKAAAASVQRIENYMMERK